MQRALFQNFLQIMLADQQRQLTRPNHDFVAERSTHCMHCGFRCPRAIAGTTPIQSEVGAAERGGPRTPYSSFRAITSYPSHPDHAKSEGRDVEAAHTKL